MIIGRRSELAHLDALIAEAAGGRGGALGFTGPAGIGKTALVERALTGTNAQVLRARGVQVEGELPFDGLQQLLEPLLGLIDRLDDRLRAPLEQALCLVPAVNGGDRRAVGSATLELLREAARVQPVIIVADDLQWLDEPSAEVLALIVRRISDLPVALIFTVRSGEPAPEWIVPLTALELAPLSPADATELLRRRDPSLNSEAQRVLVEVAGGSPLALLELSAGLSAAERRGATPIARPPRLRGDASGVFDDRIAGLAPSVRTALLTAAATATRSTNVLLRAGHQLGFDVSDVESLESAGLVTIDGPGLTFVHPLARSSVYHQAAAAERRRVHRALADVVVPDERPWHLAAGTIGTDEEAAMALEALAKRAADRTAFATAVRALELASELSPSPQQRSERAVLAAQLVLTANLSLEVSFRQIRHALATVPDEDTRLLLTYLRGILVHRAQRGVGSGSEELAAAAERALELGSAMAPLLFAQAAYVGLLGGDCVRSYELAHRGHAVMGPDASIDTRAPVLAVLATMEVIRAEPAAARAHLDELWGLVMSITPGSTSTIAVPLALNAMSLLGDCAPAQQVCDLLIQDMRATGSLTPVPVLLMTSAQCSWRLGDWKRCRDEVDEALALSIEVDQPSITENVSVIKGRLLAATGDEALARRLLGPILADAEREGIGIAVTAARAALAHLELAVGNVDAAREHLERLRHELRDRYGMVEPTWTSWMPDLIEVCAISGRVDDAQELIAELDHVGRLYDRPIIRAWVDRGRGLTAPEGYEDHFQRAIEHHQGEPMPFELARTELAFGARLHRDGRRTEAREHLNNALDLFEQLGARPWMARTESEIRAAGGRRTRAGSAPSNDLTERELEVALAVAAGMSNKQAAAALFLSVKTVEFHLGRVYDKLGVRSRTQLANRLRDLQLTD